MSRMPYSGSRSFTSAVTAVIIAVAATLAVWLLPKTTEGQQGNYPAGGVPNFPILASNGTALAPSYSFANATNAGVYWSGNSVALTVAGAFQFFCSNATCAATNTLTAGGTIGAPSYLTTTNCSSSASPAVCGSAAAGSVSLAAAATTEVVNTTAVTANSQILLQRDDSLGTKLAVTCNTATVVGTIRVSARTGGTSFTIAVDTTPATNPLCLSYWIIN